MMDTISQDRLQAVHPLMASTVAKMDSALVPQGNVRWIMGKLLFDLTGQRFGKVEVTGRGAPRYSPSGKPKVMWDYRCDCGNHGTAFSANLRSRMVKSCGCSKYDTEHLGRLSRKAISPLTPANSLFSSYKREARSRGLEFLLAREEFDRITRLPCLYCGASAGNSMRSKYHAVAYSGIDRVNNSRGYTNENSVPCCKTCNLAKRGMTVDQFFLWIRRAFSHLSVTEPIMTMNFEC
jgi:hypothetical protein